MSAKVSDCRTSDRAKTGLAQHSPTCLTCLLASFYPQKVGNLIALAGSFFLKGPRTQWKQMWHESRKHATGLYLGSLFLTLFVAFVGMPGPKGLYLVLLMLCQYAVRVQYCDLLLLGLNHFCSGFESTLSASIRRLSHMCARFFIYHIFTAHVHPLISRLLGIAYLTFHLLGKRFRTTYEDNLRENSSSGRR